MTSKTTRVIICGGVELIWYRAVSSGFLLLSYTQVKSLHPYDEPEVVALDVVAGSSSYMQWVRDSTAAVAREGD